jgi:xanthine dehydrogenase small subunit
MATPVHFMLNDKMLLTEAHEGLLVLDYLRQRARLTGTKEGCKEGDCGACSVLIGERQDDGSMRYLPVTSCLVPMGELHGKHLVTVEGLTLHRGGLNPVQIAMAENGGTQCGYCTPGFVVSMCWYMLGAPDAQPNAVGLKQAISGNLCRCTGYASINRASDQLVEEFSQDGKWGQLWTAPDRIAALAAHGLLPTYFTSVAEHLATIPPAPAPDHSVEMNLADYVIAGGTDLYVQRGEHLPESRVHVLGKTLPAGMKGVRRVNGHIEVGALTTFEEFSHDAIILEHVPAIQDYMFLIASLQIRNRATLSGNIINASPIGDMSIFLLAMDTELVFQSGGARRALPMRELYKGYKQLDRTAGELLTTLKIPTPANGTKINFEKVSKRKCLDIATVNSAAALRLGADGTFEHASISVGGVSAIPLHLRRTSAQLIGQPPTLDTVRAALATAQDEISPISDVRGTADYKRLLARQLILAHFAKGFPDQLPLAQLLEL